MIRILSLTLLLAAPVVAQQQVSPWGAPVNPPSFQSASASGGFHFASSYEGFEAYGVGAGNAEVLDISYLDEFAIANGQGPGLVIDGCSYSATTLQWNGPGWYGQVSKDILSNSGPLVLTYDNPVTSFSFTLNAYDGYGDTGTAYVYDSSNNLVATLGPFSLPDGSHVPYSYSGADIKRVDIVGSTYSWGPILDEHVFDGAGFALSASGAAGGSMTFDVAGATPAGPVALCYAFGTGSHSGTNPFTGNLVVTGLSSVRFTIAYVGAADAGGAMSYTANVPGGAAGLVSVQAIDLLSDAVSNVVNL
ncbi:MAG: hypothetical protein HQ519_16555 [Planctomycetes bacterium]|nr:hypothetical protein [Planctomycetota bacterium]